MVSFRRVVLAMSLLALFVGLAGAQVGSGGGSVGGTLSCTANAAVPPILRSEGLTELIGDITIQCTGGAITTAVGGPVPTANFTVSLATQVTSRVFGNGGSEALLFVDEPGSGEAGPGPAFAPNICSSIGIGGGVGGCNGTGLFLGNAAAPGNGTTLAACTSVAAGNCTVAPTNVFQGIVNNNQVTFNGVPIIAPVTGGFTRVFRITNIRANVSGFGGVGFAGTTPLQASVSISGSTALPVNQPVQTAGFIQQGLSTTVRNSSNSSGNTRTFLQCISGGPNGSTGSAGPAAAALLEFRENFGTAFKTRIASNTTNNGAGIGSSNFFFQNQLGTNYNSESGLIFPANGGTAGLADFGTRLRAVFFNVPAGVRVFVTATNLVTLNSAANAATVNAVTAVNNGLVAPPVAVMVPSETGTNFAGLAVPTTTFNNPPAGFSEVVIVGGTGEAVWEVVQANPAQNEVFQFGVSYIVSGNQASNTPIPGNSQVQLSYAPISTATGGSGPIPRFVDTSSPATVLTINLCQTSLLFPFVTNINGFDTGLAIANTTTDPFGTSAQNGTCTLNWYQGTTNPSPTVTPSVSSGSVYTNIATQLLPNTSFQGYMIAVCNFQFAHGFAFVSDVGARNLAMGYLALVMQNPNPNASLARGSAAEGLIN